MQNLHPRRCGDPPIAIDPNAGAITTKKNAENHSHFFHSSFRHRFVFENVVIRKNNLGARLVHYPFLFLKNESAFKQSLQKILHQCCMIFTLRFTLNQIPVMTATNRLFNHSTF